MDQLRAADWPQAGRIALGAYLLGCVATGYYLVRRLGGRDIRELGSGSIGARNVGRVLGGLGFCLTLAGDLAKGILAVWAARYFAKDERLAAIAMLAVVTGHIWPVQLRFRGGKGVATSLGALLGYDYHLLGPCLFIFAAGFALVRRTVLPALLAFGALPLIGAFMAAAPDKIISLALLAGLVLVAHRRNLVEELSRYFERRHLHPKEDSPDL